MDKIKSSSPFCLIISFTLMISITSLLGDNRSYVWTYENIIMGAGDAEIEYYLTYKYPDLDSLKDNVITEIYLELEVGMKDNFDISIYQMFQQLPDQPISYEGFKLRTRFRFSKRTNRFLEPLFYFEYIGKPDFSKHGLEGKLIFAKDMGKWNFAFNPTFEYTIHGKDRESELKYTMAIGHEINDIVKIGLEAKGSKDGQYLGPVIAHGREDLWVALGSLFAISSIEKGKPEFMLRLIIGIVPQ